MNFLILNRLQTTLVGLLRYAFSLNSSYTCVLNDNGSIDNDETGIAIYRAYPKRMPGYPVIIISSPEADSIPRCFGNDILKQEYGERIIDGVTLNGLCFQIFGGGFNANLEIAISGRTTTEREYITDWVITYLRHIYRDYLESRSIDIMEIRKGGSTTEVYGAELIYFNTINIPLFLEWERILDVDGNVVRELDISMSIILPDGSTIVVE